jgi:glutamate-1-semialdehyde aminotransferase
MNHVVSAKFVEDSESLLQRARGSVAAGDSSTMRVLDYHLPLMIERAEGAHVWDVSGKRLIDMNMGYGPLIFGHRPAALIEAIRNEMDQRGTILGFPHERSHQVAELIKKSFPSIDLMRFTSSGSEAEHTLAVVKWFCLKDIIMVLLTVFFIVIMQALNSYHLVLPTRLFLEHRA